MEEKIVCFAFSEEDQIYKRVLTGRKQFFEKMDERGLQTVVTAQGIQSFDLSAGTAEVYSPETDEQDNFTFRSLGKMAVRNIAVTLVRTNGLDPLDCLTRTINAGGVRAFGRDKLETYRLLQEVTSLSIPTYPASTQEEITRAVAEVSADTVIIKPNDGYFGEGVHRMSLREAAMWQNATGKAHILQPYIDQRIPFPEHIKPLGCAEAGRFSVLNTPNRPKELRMVSFYTASRSEIFPLARAATPGQDSLESTNEWFFLDPSSVDEGLYMTSRTVLETIAHNTGAVAIQAAVDYVYGSSNNTHEPTWHLLEVNLRTPALLGYHRHPYVADVLRTMFANQIAATATYSTLDEAV